MVWLKCYSFRASCRESEAKAESSMRSPATFQPLYPIRARSRSNGSGWRRFTAGRPGKVMLIINHNRCEREDIGARVLASIMSSSDRARHQSAG